MYGSNNWYYAYGHSSEEEILADTDYLISMTEGLPNRPYMVIDDGWQKSRTDAYNGGPWDRGNRYFPDMERLAGEIRARGAIPGIWFRPLLDREADLPEEARILRKRLNSEEISLPEEARLQQEAASAYHTLILGCNVIGHLTAGLEHLHRTGDDTSGFEWERTMRMGVNALAMRMPQHHTFFDCDADCLGITGEIPWEYNRRWGQLLASSGTPFFVSVKPGVLTENEKDELAGFLRAAASPQPPACPVDWEETIYPQEWESSEMRLHFDWYPEAGISVLREFMNV